MYKVKKTSEGSLHSRGYSFKKAEWYDVSKEMFDYLKRVFPNDFEFEQKTKENKINTIVEKEAEKEAKTTSKGRKRAAKTKDS